MKKLLIILAASAACATTGFAQAPAMQAAPAGPQKSPDQLIERRVQYLAKELGLSADQQARLQPLLLAQRQQMQTLREQRTTGGRRMGTAQDLKATQTKFDEQLKAVLTPGQYTKFDLMRGEQRDQLRQRRAAGTNQPGVQPE